MNRDAKLGFIMLGSMVVALLLSVAIWTAPGWTFAGRMLAEAVLLGIGVLMVALAELKP